MLMSQDFLFRIESPAEFFAENKNIAGFDNVSGLTILSACIRINLTVY